MGNTLTVDRRRYNKQQMTDLLYRLQRAASFAESAVRYLQRRSVVGGNVVAASGPLAVAL
jgi:hypothetical protein